MSNSLQQIQQALNLLGAVTHELREVDERLVRQIDTEQGAYRLCMAQSPIHRSDESWADIAGVSRSVFNRAKNGDGYKVNYTLPRTAQERIQAASECKAIDQWAEAYRKGELNSQRSRADRIAEARATLAALEAEQ